MQVNPQASNLRGQAGEEIQSAVRVEKNNALRKSPIQATKQKLAIPKASGQKGKARRGRLRNRALKHKQLLAPGRNLHGKQGGKQVKKNSVLRKNQLQASNHPDQWEQATREQDNGATGKRKAIESHL
jgi:hypothetical protein